MEGTNWKGDKSAYTYNGLDVRINNTQTAHSGSVYSRDYVIDYTSLERDDLMGNTRYYTKANGQSYAELTYDAWGMPESPNKLLNNDHGNYVYATYTGHIFDTTLDIYFAEARFYDANTRTWLAMDPIKDGDNWYQYCYSNPLKYWDPTGLSGFTKYACDFFNNVKGQFDQAVNSVKSWAYSVDWGRFGIGLAKGLGAVALLVGGIAVIGATGGAALPVVVGSLSSTAILWATQILGAATIAFGLSDLMEVAQDIAKSLVSPETGSINPLRDQIFGMLGINPEDYYIIEALVGSAATAGASVVNAFALSGQAISLQDYIKNHNTASSNQTLIYGDEWYRYFQDTYGAENVTWNVNSFDDIVKHPTSLRGYTAEEIGQILGDGWIREAYGSNGSGWKYIEKAHPDNMVFYHGGGGYHEGAYWGIKSGTTGTIKVVDTNTYVPTANDKATIIYGEDW